MLADIPESKKAIELTAQAVTHDFHHESELFATVPPRKKEAHVGSRRQLLTLPEHHALSIRTIAPPASLLTAGCYYRRNMWHASSPRSARPATAMSRLERLKGNEGR